MIPTASGIRTFEQSKTGQYICSIDFSGTLLIHSLSYTSSMENNSLQLTSHEQEKRAGSVVSRKNVRTELQGCKVSWFPCETKQLVVLPSSTGNLLVYSKEGSEWIETNIVPDGLDLNLSHNEADLCMVAFSPNGRYLASVDINGTLLIWEVDTENISNSAAIRRIDTISSVENEPLCDIVWGVRTTDNYLLVLGQE
jgi:WD40 repeat protein